MLKKQTVWLLTMLSLMIVLSVYYIMSEQDGQTALINNEEADLTTSDETTDQEADEDADATEVNDISNVGQDQLFTTFRMELQNERSMKKDNLKEIVKSSTASTDEKNDALNDINTLDETTTKESILQSSILDAASDYQDVLVRHDKDIIHVHVKAGEQLSNKEVVDIMQMVRDEFGEMTVNVNRQPTES